MIFFLTVLTEQNFITNSILKRFTVCILKITNDFIFLFSSTYLNQVLSIYYLQFGLISNGLKFKLPFSTAKKLRLLLKLQTLDRVALIGVVFFFFFRGGININVWRRITNLGIFHGINCSGTKIVTYNFFSSN